MASTFSGLDIALTGIYASQMRLNVAAHNIANADTPGYSKQSVDVKAGEPISCGVKGGMWGTGVDMSHVYSNRSEFYDTKYRASVALENEYETKNYYLKSIENYFNETNSEALVASYDEFFQTMGTLSTDASSLEKRTIMNQIGKTFAENCANNYASLQSIQSDINDEIKSCVEKINIISQQILSINREINTLEVSGATVNDLRDRREALIDELSLYVNVETREKTVNVDKDGNGQKEYSVYINGEQLLDTNSRNILECRERKELNNQNDADSLFDVYWHNTDEPFNIGQKGLNGKLNALYDMRDGNNLDNFKGTLDATAEVADNILLVKDTNQNDINKMDLPKKGYITFNGRKYLYDGFEVKVNEDGKFDYYFNMQDDSIKKDSASIKDKSVRIGEGVNFKGIPYYLDRLNEFVRSFSQKFNSIHGQGKDLSGEGGIDYFTYKDKKTGAEVEMNEYNNNFKTSDANSYYNMTASQFVVSDKVINAPKKIAVSGDISKGVDENSNILKLIQIQNDRTLYMQGSGTQYLHSIIDEIAVDTLSFEKLSKNQNNITQIVDERRMSEAGVDLDEESMDMLKYQQAYKMSAKVFSIMSEIYNTLIEM